MRALLLSTFLLALLAPPGAYAQAGRPRGSVEAAVTYVSSGSIYLDAGRSKGVSQGDTVTFRHGSRLLGLGIISAVSSGSSAARPLQTGETKVLNAVAVGDSAFITRQGEDEAADQSQAAVAAEAPAVKAPGPPQGTERSPVGPADNRVSGRVALQYAQAGVPGAAPDFSQPSVYSRLTVTRLLGTRVNLSFFARTYWNAALRKYDEGSRNRFRLYDLSLSYDEADAAVGWSAGRVTSSFVGGLGQVDGGQIYVKSGKVSVGVLAGLQPDYRTSGVATEDQKGALFAHYGWEGEEYSRWGVTVAYGRQFHSGKLDRDFLYLQNSARLGLGLFLYQSTEIDLHVMGGGRRTGKFRLTNTYATLTYMPLAWLTASAGYDATRNIYLLESMKWFPDSLFDQTLRQGCRASLSVRLPLSITLTGNGRFRPASGAERQTHSLGGGVRFFDLGGTGLSIGGQYADLVGVYTDGTDMTVDADAWITRDLSLMLRYDRYTFDLLTTKQHHMTTTGSAMLQWRFSGALHAMVHYDRVWDTLRDNERLMCELGVRF